MYQTEITEKEAGQRFDKYLHRLLPEAGKNFLYKMLRKKNILLNGRRADGGEKLCEGDLVALYFAEATLAKFMGREIPGASPEGGQTPPGRRQEDGTAEYETAYQELFGIRILYENAHILLADKPVGVLSQKAESWDLSLNEWLIGYLLHSGALTAEELSMYKPSVCNRLDRNTGGIVLCAKSLRGAQLLGTLLRERTLHKYYQAFVRGTVTDKGQLEGYLRKDQAYNRVYVEKTSGRQPAGANLSREEASSRVKMIYRPIAVQGDKTLLEVELITGKSHQIRAQLASIGHPILGDYKYGDRAVNEACRRKYHVESQLLYAYKVVFPPLESPFEDISGRTFQAELPDSFARMENGGNCD